MYQNCYIRQRWLLSSVCFIHFVGNFPVVHTQSHHNVIPLCALKLSERRILSLHNRTATSENTQTNNELFADPNIHHIIDKLPLIQDIMTISLPIRTRRIKSLGLFNYKKPNIYLLHIASFNFRFKISRRMSGRKV